MARQHVASLRSPSDPLVVFRTSDAALAEDTATLRVTSPVCEDDATRIALFF